MVSRTDAVDGNETRFGLLCVISPSLGVLQLRPHLIDPLTKVLDLIAPVFFGLVLGNQGRELIIDSGYFVLSGFEALL